MIVITDLDILEKLGPLEWMEALNRLFNIDSLQTTQMSQNVLKLREETEVTQENKGPCGVLWEPSVCVRTCVCAQINPSPLCITATDLFVVGRERGKVDYCSVSYE